jgi:hypothetical protein
MAVANKLFRLVRNIRRFFLKGFESYQSYVIQNFQIASGLKKIAPPLIIGIVTREQWRVQIGESSATAPGSVVQWRRNGEKEIYS